MASRHRRHSAKSKFTVALAAAKGTKTLGELASEHQLHPSQIIEWNPPHVEEMTTSVRSWIAHAEHGDTWRLRSRIFSDYPLEKRVSSGP